MRYRGNAAAGYAGSDKVLGVNGAKLLHDPDVQAAIKEVSLGMASSEGIGLMAMLLQIAYGQIPATANERMKAAAMIFNRTGMPERTEAYIKVEHSVSNDDAINELYRFAKVLDVPPEKLIGSMGIQIIDGEFKELEERDQNEEVVGADGGGSVLARLPDLRDNNPDTDDDPFAWDGEDQ